MYFLSYTGSISSTYSNLNVDTSTAYINGGMIHAEGTATNSLSITTFTGLTLTATTGDGGAFNFVNNG